MALRIGVWGNNVLRNTVIRSVVTPRRYIQSSASPKGMLQFTLGTFYTPQTPFVASVSPFTEATSPNPTVSLYAQTTESLHTYGSYLIQCLPKFIQQFSVLKDELTVYVAPSGLIPVLTFLRDHSQCQFKAVMDISGVDFPEREKRFEVVYHLLSIQHQGRIRVKTYAGEADHVPSACELFRGADWLVNVLKTSNAHFHVAGMSEKLGIFMEFSSATIQICV
jgi:NADH dehydrogenase (ubiquinone) Fe-S protein 3